MNMLGKIAVVAAMAGGLVAAAAPAEAGVSVGIGIGVPGPGYGYRGHYCYYHPGACGYGRPYYRDGFFVAGRGYWHANRWWGHRGWYHGGWRYR
jgi:hypothetical protein